MSQGRGFARLWGVPEGCVISGVVPEALYQLPRL